MKIAKVETFPLSYTLPIPRGDARGLSAARRTCVTRITTDDGAQGWGQGGRADTIRDLLAPVLIGQDPRETGALWQRMNPPMGRADRGSVGAVDVALWDLKGKLTGQPIARLLGGAVRERVPAYASLHNYTPGPDLSDELAAAIREAKSRGFRALKLKIGGRPVAEDLRYLRLAREVAGPELDLMADANYTYDVPTAVKVGRVLEGLGFAWFEEPLHTSDVPGYVHLREKLEIAIAGYEGTGDPAAIAPVLAARAIDVYQPDVVGSGGFSVIQHLPVLAAAFGVNFTCHVWDSALVHVASLHLLATLLPWQHLSMAPLPPRLETTTLPRQPLNAELLLDPPVLQPDGTFLVPTKPGLGVEVNPETLEKYAG
jgi:D-galactarolactone cycloisomerase